MKFNRALADEALANIEADPETWDQKGWRCGTACCFAGHVALAAGWSWLNPENPDDAHVTKNGIQMHAEYAADLELGFESGRGYSTGIYHGTNTLEDLQGYVEALTGVDLLCL